MYCSIFCFRQNYLSADKIFVGQRFSSFMSDEKFNSVLIIYCIAQFSVFDKIICRTKIFVTSKKFRHFCPKNVFNCLSKVYEFYKLFHCAMISDWVRKQLPFPARVFFCLGFCLVHSRKAHDIYSCVKLRFCRDTLF